MKLRRDGSCVSVFAELTLAFPLLVAASFAADFRKQRGVDAHAPRNMTTEAP